MQRLRKCVGLCGGTTSCDGGFMAAVFGKYQLIAQLGEGGMAQVFLAALAGPRGSGFSKLTVIKRLRSSYEDDPEFITMLVDEARIAARLNHANVVQTHEVGEVDGKYFLAMEYLDGHSLHRIQNRTRAIIARGEQNRGLTKAMGYVIVLDVLAGLHHAHELSDYDGTPLGIVHRDVTPPNVFVTYDGQVKVVDFGIAKAAGRGSETRHGVIKGKVRYMAPEQAIGNAVDRRADIFSVGIILWEIATGERRWKEDNEVSIVGALLANEAYIPPRDIDPSVPPEIEAMVQKALSFNPEDRYATAEQFRRELEEYLMRSGELGPARSKLGPMVATLFKDKRDELKQVIEKRLNSVSSSEVAPMMLTVHTDADRSSKREISLPGTSSAPAVLSAAPPTSTRTFGLIALVAVAAVGAIAVAVVKSTQAQPAPIVVQGNASPVEREVVISVTANPSSARITLDGAEVTSPYEAKVERSSDMHTIRIEADGFEPETKSVVFDRSQALTVALKATATKSPPTPTPANTPPPFVGVASRTTLPQRGVGIATPPAKSAPSVVAVASSSPPPPPTAKPSTTPTPTATSKFKRDIDRSDPFATSGGAPAKTIDKSSPFAK